MRHLSVRPERLSLTDAADADLCGVVTRHTYLGTDVRISVTLDDQSTVTVRVPNTAGAGTIARNARVGLKIEADAARLLTD